MIKLKTTKKPFRKEEFSIVDYNVDDLKKNVPDLTKNPYEHMILQVDGGGILGVHPALHLYVLEEKMGIQCNKVFKSLWGTSTGSIIASLVAVGVPAKDILTLYVELGPKIFEQIAPMANILSKKSYDTKFIEELLFFYFGDKTFYDIKKSGMDLNIAVVDAIRKETTICNVSNTPMMLIRNAVRGSMSAPMYFGPYHFTGNFRGTFETENLLFDGGTGTYNCLLEKAICEFMYKKEVLTSDFLVYSLGCGYPIYIDDSKNKIEEILSYRKIRQAVWAIGFGRNESVDKQIKWAKYRSEDCGLNFKRFDFKLPKHLSAMDDTNNIDDLINTIQKQMGDVFYDAGA